MRYLFIFILLSTFICADDIGVIAKKLNLFAGTKAAIQWERVFSSQRRMQKYNIQALAQDTKNKLRVYLIEHAADSEKPIVPGL